MEVLPGDGYLNSDENNDLLDKDFGRELWIGICTKEGIVRQL